MKKQSSFFFVSAGGLVKQIFSRETLLLRGGRKGDPDTKSGLGTNAYRAKREEKFFHFA